MEDSKQTCSLVNLPSPCLLTIMQYCSDYSSLFSAARAHSTLRSAAAAALSSITLEVKHDRVIASLLAYLSMHGQYIEHVGIRSNYRWRHEKAKPLQFPPTVQLMSLKLQCMPVALCTVQEAGPSSFRGVLTGQARLKQLSLQDCIMREGAEGLAAALQQLQALEHLDVQMPRKDRDYNIAFPSGVLPGLQALTFLQLAQGAQGGLHDLSALPDVAALTGLLDLRLHPGGRLTKDVLAPLTCLTSLCLAQSRIEAGALKGKPHLQHLNVAGAVFSEGGSLFGKASVLLSELQHLQELTYLNMRDTLRFPEQHGPPVEAYAAITASSKLQHLNIADNILAKGFWGSCSTPTGRYFSCVSWQFGAYPALLPLRGPPLWC